MFAMSEFIQMSETGLFKISPEYSIDRKEYTLIDKFGDIPGGEHRKMRVFKNNIFYSTLSRRTTTTNYLHPWEISYTEPSIESWIFPFWYMSVEEKTVDSILDSAFLSISKELVTSLFRDVKKLNAVEDVFYNLEEVPDRPPGFIIEIITVIPESNREIEYKIYDALGKLMRDNPKMLIDLHVVKRRGREIKEVIPPEYLRCRE